MGPLFFSGLIKSRTLAQMKKKLQDAIAYHHNAADKLKADSPNSVNSRSESIEEKSVTPDSESSIDLLPQLTLIDLTGESVQSDDSTISDSDDSDTEQSASRDETSEATSEEERKNNLIQYHVGAEKLVQIFCLTSSSLLVVG